MKKSTMKRVHSIMICSALAVMLCACHTQNRVSHTDGTSSLHNTTSNITSERASNSTTESELITLSSTDSVFSSTPFEETAKDPFAYVPEDEWLGAETTDYMRYLDIVAISDVLANPKGSPDPTWHITLGKVIVDFDFSQITCKTQKEKYSLEDENVKVDITLDANSEYERVYYCDFWNIERWDGLEWERLIHTPSGKYFGPAKATYPYVEPGQTQTIAVKFTNVANKMIPGRYRVVAYLNAQQIYAEFELTE